MALTPIQTVRSPKDGKGKVILLRALRDWRDVRRAARGIPAVSCAYLGRDPKGKIEAEGLLGAKFLIPLRNRIEQTGQDLMAPYIDAVGRLSTEQKDVVGWLASKFASRSIWQTKYFHRLVMTRLGVDIIAGDAPRDGFVLVVEDPWVFEALRAALDGNGPAYFVGRGRLRAPRYHQWLMSPLKRLGLAVSMALLRLLMSAVFLWQKRSPVRPPTGDVFLHAYVEDRTLSPDGQYRDEYLGILGDIAEENGFTVSRMTHLWFPLRLICRLARNQTLWPLVLSLPYSSILSCLWKRWQPTALERQEIPGIPPKALAVLLQAERLAERGAGHMYYRLSFAAYSALFKRFRPRAIVYPFENQPWEKLLCWAVRSHGSETRVLGFQQSTVARFFVHFFRSRSEDDRFFPDAVLVGGERFAELLASGGWDRDRLCVCGALRHSEALTAASVYVPGRVPKAGGTVIVALPVDVELTREILFSLQEAFPDGGKTDGVKFLVRLHPAGVNGCAADFSNWLKRVEIDRRPYLQSLKDESVACVLTAMGASGLEALFLGLPVARFRSDLSIDIDPLDRYAGSGVWVVNASSLRRVILDLVRDPPRPSPERLGLLETYFARPDPRRVLEALQEKGPLGR